MTILAIPRPRPWGVARLVGWAKGLFGAVAAVGDALVVGLVLAFVAFSAIGAPALFLGIPDVVAVFLVGAVTAGIALGAAVLAIALRRAIHALTTRIVAVPVVAARPRLAGIIRIPHLVLGALPVGWLTAFAAFLWLVVVGESVVAPSAILQPQGSTVPYLYLVGVAGAGLGLAAWLLRAPDARPLPGVWRRRAGTALVVAVAAVLVAGASLAWWPGDAAGVVHADPIFDGPSLATDLDDPGVPGDLAVEQLSYGTGTDARRPEFGRDADLITTTVDGSRRLAPLPPGADAARSWFWGFDTDQLPIQGLAWLPVGKGPYPLVLIVHGNHAMGDVPRTRRPACCRSASGSTPSTPAWPSRSPRSARCRRHSPSG